MPDFETVAKVAQIAIPFVLAIAAGGTWYAAYNSSQSALAALKSVETTQKTTEAQILLGFTERY